MCPVLLNDFIVKKSENEQYVIFFSSMTQEAKQLCEEACVEVDKETIDL